MPAAAGCCRSSRRCTGRSPPYSATSAMYQPEEAIIVAAPIARCPIVSTSLTAGAGDQEHQGQARHDQERLQHLGQEGETQRTSRQCHPPRAGPGRHRPDRAHHDRPPAPTAARGAHRDVVAEHRGRHRWQRQRDPGDQCGSRAAGPAHRGIEQMPPHRRPSMPAGSGMPANSLKPNSRPDNPIAHMAAGGLSTVMALPASIDPKQPGLPGLGPGLGHGGVVAVGPPPTSPDPTGGAPAVRPAGPSRRVEPNACSPASAIPRALPRRRGAVSTMVVLVLSPGSARRPRGSARDGIPILATTRSVPRGQQVGSPPVPRVRCRGAARAPRRAVVPAIRW